MGHLTHYVQNRQGSALRFMLPILLALLVVFLAFYYYTEKPQTAAGLDLAAEMNQQLQAKWGKSLMELPAVNLILISPHNEQIRSQFEQAFVRQYALQHGKRVLLWWRDVGGSNAILTYMLTEQQQGRSPQIDVVFGGGVYLFRKLAEANMLRPLELSEEILQAIPAEFAGLHMIDPGSRWCGNVLSGFGFLYNKELLAASGLEALETWQDLGKAEMFDQLILADPSVSGSTVMAFEMILQSAEDWPSGWADLLSILSNTKEFAASSDDAANGPLFGQRAATICIDFYGISRAALQPDTLVYVSPPGQTAYTPDPIAILQDAPNPELAHAFVEFVLSSEGQELWGLQTGSANTVALNSLCRNPIRSDFYQQHGTQRPAGAVNPYQQGAEFRIDPKLRDTRFGVLVELIRAAAVDNFETMKAAKAKLIETGFDTEHLRIFNALPEDIDTLEEIYTLSKTFSDPAAKEQITAAWKVFFAEKYKKVIE